MARKPRQKPISNPFQTRTSSPPKLRKLIMPRLGQSKQGSIVIDAIPPLQNVHATLVRYDGNGDILSEEKFPFRFCWGDTPPVFEITLPDEVFKDYTHGSILVNLSDILSEMDWHRPSMPSRSMYDKTKKAGLWWKKHTRS